MVFVEGLAQSRGGNEGIWDIVDQFIKNAHFIHVKSTRTTLSLATLYIREVVRLHGIPTRIVRDQDLLFTSHFWLSL